MKKSRKWLSLLLGIAMMLSMLAMPGVIAEAEKTAEITVGFADMAATEDFASAAEQILARGVEATENLVIGDCYSTLVSAKGYNGPGYVVVKLNAGEGKAFENAVQITVNYRLSKGDPQGYMVIEGSVDGVNYIELLRTQEATGDAWTQEAMAETALNVEGIAGLRDVWIKVTLEGWGGPDAAGLDGICASAAVKEDAEAAVQDDAEAAVQDDAEAAIGFADMAATEDFASAAEQILARGAIKTENLVIGDCYTTLVSAKGYNGPGYVLVRLNSGEGKAFENAAQITVKYRLSKGDPQGYMVVEVSTDGVSFTELLRTQEATGDAWTQEAMAETTLSAEGLAGTHNLWIKVTLEGWGGPDAAGLDGISASAGLIGDAAYVPGADMELPAEEVEEATEEAAPEAQAPELPDYFVLDVASSDATVQGHEVKSVLDFAGMNAIAEGATAEEKAASKAAAKEALLAAGAVDADNLFLKGNHETVVNPGGYNGPGYFIQKAEALEGETIENAKLDLDYWVADGDPQGYVEIYASADGEEYTLVFRQRQGNGSPWEPTTKQRVTLLLPAAEGQKEIYVKAVMEHWNTYEGAAISSSAITVNKAPTEKVETALSPEELTMVSRTYYFNGLVAGEVEASDIGAVDERNMFFGIDGVPLLSPRNGYETASATWQLSAEEGQPLDDCILTIVGRTWWQNPDVKDDNYLKVFVSVDGDSYTLAQEFHATDDEDDTQRFTVDLSDFVSGYPQAFVKLEWLVFDSPHIFGIRSITLSGNLSGVRKGGGESGKMAIVNVQNFTDLEEGEAEKDDLDAYKTANLVFGYNGTQLLTQCEAGEDAYVTWLLKAAEGETFEDCHLMLTGRFSYTDASFKDSSAIRIYLCTDGQKYNKVREIVPSEDASDDQKYLFDFTDQVYGLSEVYVRVYWTSEDDPSMLGLKTAALVANTGEDYLLYLPE
ncbi:MAG: hypothetical protein IKR85_05525 [Clostridia bacterium]|nr:hypothetical protein [Clostridia bacterium]